MRIATDILLLVLVGSKCLAQGPAILSVRTGADYADATSVGIPRGSIFTIEGTGLASSAVSASAAPLATTLNGVSVRVWDATTNGNMVGVCPLWYVSPTQVNAVMPSPFIAGMYYLSVLTQGLETGRLPILITNGRFVPFSRTSRGFGPAVVQQYGSSGGPILNELTAPSAVGATLVIWGTGLGPLLSGSDAASPSAATLRSDVFVYIDGLRALPFYAGRAPGLPGVDQINVVMPQGVEPRCFVSLQIVTGGVPSSIETISVSQDARSSCQSELGMSAAALAALDAGGAVHGAILRLTSTTSASNGSLSQAAEAWMADYRIDDLSVLQTSASPSLTRGTGICLRDPVDRTYGENTTASLPAPAITGSGGCSWAFAANGSSLQGTPQSGCIAESFAFSGALFTASGSIPPPRSGAAISAVSSTQSAQGLTIAWSATPASSDIAFLTLGSSYTPVAIFGTPQTQQATLVCQVAATDQPFTVSSRDVTWAVQYPNVSPVSLSLTATSDQVFPASGSVDFVLVRALNSVVAQAAIQ